MKLLDDKSAHACLLEYLFLYNNRFSEGLPYEFFRIPAMIEMSVQNNQMSGTIPPEIQNLRKLEILRLENNAIQGPIPDVFEYLTSLSEYGMSGRCFFFFCGPNA